MDPVIKLSSCCSSQVKRLTAPYPWVTTIFRLWWRESWTHKRCVCFWFFLIFFVFSHPAEVMSSSQPTYNYTEHELKRETLTLKDFIRASVLDLEDFKDSICCLQSACFSLGFPTFPSVLLKKKINMYIYYNNWLWCLSPFSSLPVWRDMTETWALTALSALLDKNLEFDVSNLLS